MPWPAAVLGSSLYQGFYGALHVCRDLAQKVAVANTVMVTWANWHYLDFVLNWVTHLQREQVSAFMVGAMDDALLQVRRSAHTA